MKMEKEMKYEAPEVLLLEVEVERGFAGSGVGGDSGFGGDDDVIPGA